MESPVICAACGHQDVAPGGPCPACGEPAPPAGEQEDRASRPANSSAAHLKELAPTRKMLEEERDEESAHLPCPGCGRPMSSYVNKCPNCGAHTHRTSHDRVARRVVFTRSFLPLLAGAIVLVAALALIGYVIYQAVSNRFSDLIY